VSTTSPDTAPPAADDSTAAHDLRAGIVAGVSAYLLWGFLTVYWKLLTEFDPFDLIGWRIVTSALIMAGGLTVAGRWAHLVPVLRNPRLLGRVVVAAVLLTINWTSYVWAVVNDHVIETALGYFMAPLGTILIGVVVFGERLVRAQKIAVLLAVAAVVVLAVSYGAVPWLALAIAASWSLYGWLKKQVPLSPIESMSAESFVLLVPALVAIAVIAPQSDSVLSSASLGEFVLVGLTGVATVVPLTMFARAAQHVPLTVLGPLQYSVPTINFVLGWAVYGEDMPLSRLVGFALVWVGLVLVSVDTWSRSRQARADRRSTPTPLSA
jgi:chloramphenicol-sensitive protein RarD